MTTVTFGTPVSNYTGGGNSVVLPSITVTSGQPIIVVCHTANSNTDTFTFSDTFAGHYTAIYVDGGASSSNISSQMYVLCDGSGTSGVITATLTGGWFAFWVEATPCIGASTGTTLATIIDKHGAVSYPTASTTISSPSLTPANSGEGAVYACAGTSALTAIPSSPWANTYYNNGTSNIGAADVYASPTSGVALSTTWAQTTSGSYTSVACVVLPAQTGTAPAFTSASPPGVANVGVPYSFTFVATGFPAPTFSVYSGTPPTGLSLVAATGVLSGTPSTGGSFTFTVEASNTSGNVETSAITITAVALPVVTAASPPAATVSVAYSYTFIATSYPAATFAVASGSLPPGLSLASSGGLTGTPTTAGTYQFGGIRVRSIRVSAVRREVCSTDAVSIFPRSRK